MVSASPKADNAVPDGPTKESVPTSEATSIGESAQALRRAYLERVNGRYSDFLKRTRQRKTEAEYQMVARRAIDRADPPSLAQYPRRARPKIRAAIVLYGIWAISDALKLYFKGGDCAGPDARAAAVEEGIRWLARIEAVEAEVDEGNEVGNAMIRNPARRKLAALPENWEQALFEAAKAHPKWFLGLSVSLATGARPIELERGVTVRRDGPNLEFIVTTAKASEQHEGIGTRSILLPPETPWVEALAAELGERAEMVVKWPNAKKSFDQIAAMGRAALLDAKPAISGYTLRHRFACLLKQAGLPPVEIARALGHTSTKQLSSYGHWNAKVRGGGLPLRVRSEREPRVIDKPRSIPARRLGNRSPIAG
jgi:integrase